MLVVPHLYFNCTLFVDFTVECCHTGRTLPLSCDVALLCEDYAGLPSSLHNRLRAYKGANPWTDIEGLAYNTTLRFWMSAFRHLPQNDPIRAKIKTEFKELPDLAVLWDKPAPKERTITQLKNIVKKFLNGQVHTQYYYYLVLHALYHINCTYMNRRTLNLLH
jgi:hypothetical protein